eukprot:1157698-Pelagomonas_calceolata.AAC.3
MVAHRQGQDVCHAVGRTLRMKISGCYVPQSGHGCTVRTSAVLLAQFCQARRKEPLAMQERGSVPGHTVSVTKFGMRFAKHCRECFGGSTQRPAHASTSACK